MNKLLENGREMVESWEAELTENLSSDSNEMDSDEVTKLFNDLELQEMVMSPRDKRQKKRKYNY